MIPSRRLIMLALMMTVPLFMGGIPDLLPDAIPALGQF